MLFKSKLEILFFDAILEEKGVLEDCILHEVLSVDITLVALIESFLYLMLHIQLEFVNLSCLVLC